MKRVLNKAMIFIDMDGVLARFEEQPKALDRFVNEKGFFTRLDLTAFAKKLQKQLANNEIDTNRVAILTASPNKQADNDKLLWIKKHLPQIKNIVIVREGEQKAKFAKNNILIDDYTRNLEFWLKNGGYGIKAINKHNGKTKRHLDYKIPEMRVDY